MNRVCIIGRLTRDPEIRMTQDQKAIARLGIAVDIKRDQANFFNVTAWEKTAEFCEKHLKKGVKVGIEGQLRTDDYTNRDGQKVSTVYILADRIEFCEKKQEEKPNDGFMDIPKDLGEELPFNF